MNNLEYNENLFCSICRIETKHSIRYCFYDLDQNQYILLQFVGDNRIKVYNDPNNTYLPSRSGEINYKIISAVVRNGVSHLNGHFLVWIRKMNELGWIKISDSNGTVYRSLLKYLDDVNFIVLKKKN